MYDLNWIPKLSKDKENVWILKRSIELGLRYVAWNTVCIGKVNSNQHKPTPPIILDQNLLQDAWEQQKVLQPVSLSSSSSHSNVMKQFSRITIIIDDILDAQALSLGNNSLKAFDIVAVRPGNTKVLEYICKNSEIDIISIDFSVKYGLNISKNSLDAATKRGIFFEICYTPILSSSNARKEMIGNTKIVIQYLRGRNLILSSGADSYNQLRSPQDVINIGQVLQLTYEQAAKAIGENCVKVLKHATARRLRYIPVEVLSMKDILSRYPWIESKLSKAQNTWKCVLSTNNINDNNDDNNMIIQVKADNDDENGNESADELDKEEEQDDEKDRNSKNDNVDDKLEIDDFIALPSLKRAYDDNSIDQEIDKNGNEESENETNSKDRSSSNHISIKKSKMNSMFMDDQSTSKFSSPSQSSSSFSSNTHPKNILNNQKKLKIKMKNKDLKKQKLSSLYKLSSLK